MQKLRKVWILVRDSKTDERGFKSWLKTFSKESEGWFHCFSTFADQDGSACYAVVEKLDGTVITCDAHMIQFQDNP